ncbi:hypothetical protein [Micromonospora sp. NBC_01796]|uniref:hypothetical protein n=1 Tax=Micromonospora sp. NBC_01796 TaxID=2975987 RepID=UPI002DDA707D|nr:hypothetical protein [Micromonospora sp. NBC_01796]WSA89098.1 hypothetical protein OIE47_16630 [Micromonospora sp. NBC_01796]
MAGVEFGPRTRAFPHTLGRVGDRAGRGVVTGAALALAALVVLTAGGLAALTAAEPGWAAAAGTRMVPESEEPGGGGTTPEDPEPSQPPETEQPSPTPTSVPTTETPTDVPTTVVPTEPPPPDDPPVTGGPGPVPASPTPSSALPRPRPQPGQPRFGVTVTTGDINLTSAYWGARSTTADLLVTVANTGDVPQHVRMRYTLPAGVTDAGTQGCSAAGAGTYRCGAWTAAAGARFTARIRVSVAADAWQQMPLDGSVQVSATDPARPTLAAVTDDEGFAVLFPPGPPSAGLTLGADEVNFDVTGGPTTLSVRLGNTGTADAAGTAEVVLPAGVTVPTPPAGCRSTGPSPSAPAPTGTDPASPDPNGTGPRRVACDLGPIRAGQTATVRLPVNATADAQRMAPLSGAAIGTLTPAHGRTSRMQMSFRINAVAASSTSTAAGAAPAGSQGLLPVVRPVSRPDDGLTGTQRTAIGLIVVSGLLVVLALTLAAVTLRRHTP